VNLFNDGFSYFMVFDVNFTGYM